MHGIGSLATRICIVDDRSELQRELLDSLQHTIPKSPPIPPCTLAICASSEDFKPPEKFYSNREIRQAQQPFYRGLKKYRKHL